MWGFSKIHKEDKQAGAELGQAQPKLRFDYVMKYQNLARPILVERKFIIHFHYIDESSSLLQTLFIAMNIVH